VRSGPTFAPYAPCFLVSHLERPHESPSLFKVAPRHLTSRPSDAHTNQPALVQRLVHVLIMVSLPIIYVHLMAGVRQVLRDHRSQSQRLRLQISVL